jgi:glutathione synthase/RimK-type ligase-like ATP-grasp enzyme
MILIITHKEDFTADFVINQLNAASIPYFRLNCEDLAEYPYSVGFSGGFQLSLGNNERFTAVWFRRVKKPNVTLEDAHIADYIASELLALLNNFYHLLDCKWVSHPEYIYKAENKLVNLRKAVELGFIIPETLVTNQRQAIVDFYHQHDGDVIIKPIFNNKILFDSHKQVVFTNKVRPEHIAQLDRYFLTPSIFQRNIPKAYEIRVTVVGQHVFAASVDSQSSATTQQDWRKEKLAFQPYVLPEVVANRCRSLVCALNLNFGAIDLIKATDGQYYFLEINPNGQWAWMEMECGLPISNALIRELTT